MKILITDDDKNLRKVLSLELSDAGFEVDEAESGLVCIEKLEKEEFDVVLLDLLMPKMYMALTDWRERQLRQTAYPIC